MLEIVEAAHSRGVKVRLAPKTTELLVQRGEYVPGQGVPLFELRPPVLAGADWIVKRTFDLVVSLLVVVLGLPIWLAIAAAIKLDSRGPVFYRDRRVGRRRARVRDVQVPDDGGRTPTGSSRGSKAQNEAEGALFKIRDDPRVTRVGAVLRRLSLDELPQVLNVLRGEMSLVGPRPLPLRDYDMLDGLAPQALPRPARNDRPLADLGPLEPLLRRPRPARLLLPRELVDLARHLDPRQDDPGGARPPRRVLTARPGLQRLHPCSLDSRV